MEDNDLGQLGNGMGCGDCFDYNEGIDSIYSAIIVLIYLLGDVNNGGKVMLDDAIGVLKLAMKVTS